MKILKFAAISSAVIAAIVFAFIKFSTPPIVPTGFYEMEDSSKNTLSDSSKFKGAILVNQITKGKLAVTFLVNKGAKSDSSRSFMDTLDFKDNMAIYRKNDSEQSCRITMKFSSKGIQVLEQTGDFGSGCGYGHGMITDGYFKKISTKIPAIKALEKAEVLAE